MKPIAPRVAVVFAAVAATVLGSIPAASAAEPLATPRTETTQLAAPSAHQQITDEHAADEHTGDGHGVELGPAAKIAPKPAKLLGWDPPNPRSYTITASCAQWAGEIRQGAAAWNGLTEGGGTPVSCQTSYITDCGGTGAIIGCNYGSGQRITLVPTATGQIALLAAHEFGHDWYGHSGSGCANWNSPADVMRTTICG